MTLASGPHRRRWPIVAAVAGLVVVGALIAIWRGSRDTAGSGAEELTPRSVAAGGVEQATTHALDVQAIVDNVCATGDVGAAAVALRPGLPRTTDAGVRLATAYLEWLLKYPANADYDTVARSLVYVDDPSFTYGQTLLTNLSKGYQLLAAEGTSARSVLPDSIRASVESGASSDPLTLQVVVKLTSRAMTSDGMSRDALVTQTVFVDWGVDGWRISALTALTTPPTGTFVPAAPLCG